jgi:hypothetical protein
MKKILFFILIILSISILLTSCNSGGSDNGDMGGNAGDTANGGEDTSLGETNDDTNAEDGSNKLEIKFKRLLNVC